MSSESRTVVQGLVCSVSPLFTKCIPGSSRSEKAAAAALRNMTHHPFHHDDGGDDYEDEDDDHDEDEDEEDHDKDDQDEKASSCDTPNLEILGTVSAQISVRKLRM